jgi:predicted nucleic acid-binding protein
MIPIRIEEIDNFKKIKVFVDTNVLLWTHYSKVNEEDFKTRDYQIVKYPNAIEKLLENQNYLVTTSVNCSEMFNIIIRHEIALAKANNVEYAQMYDKEIRNQSDVRKDIQLELKSVIAQLKNLYDIIDLPIDIQELERYAEEYKDLELDINDYLMIKKLEKESIHVYLTDDKDFASFDSNTANYMITANNIVKY